MSLRKQRGLFVPFLKYEIPTLSRINKTQSHCIGLFHGQDDVSIFPSHTERLHKDYNGKRDLMVKFYPGKGHVMMASEVWNDAFFIPGCL